MPKASTPASPPSTGPFEYLLLRLDPEPWRDEDSILVLYAMYFELNDEIGSRESARGLLADLLDPELAAFLVPAGTSWDAALDGGTMAVPPMPVALPTDSEATAAAAAAFVDRRRSDHRSSAATTGRWPDRGPPTAGPSSPTTCTWV